MRAALNRMNRPAQGAEVGSCGLLYESLFLSLPWAAPHLTAPAHWAEVWAGGGAAGQCVQALRMMLMIRRRRRMTMVRRMEGDGVPGRCAGGDCQS